MPLVYKNSPVMIYVPAFPLAESRDPFFFHIFFSFFLCCRTLYNFVFAPIPLLYYIFSLERDWVKLQYQSISIF